MAKVTPFTINNVSTPDAVQTSIPTVGVTIMVDPTDSNYASAEFNVYEPGSTDGPARMEPGRAYTFKKQPIVSAGEALAQGYLAGEIVGYAESVGIASVNMLKIEL